MPKAIITYYREDGSIIGDVEIREDVSFEDFPKIADEINAKADDPDDEIAYAQLLGA